MVCGLVERSRGDEFGQVFLKMHLGAAVAVNVILCVWTCFFPPADGDKKKKCLVKMSMTILIDK